jgi:hypothetical protein
MNMILFMLAGKKINLGYFEFIFWIDFFILGYETTSSTLTYCTYVMAKHPDEQIKLFDEINSHFHQDSKVITEMKKFYFWFLIFS